MAMTSDASAVCATCGAAATNKCGGCKTHVYCSKQCQVRNWPTHKDFCKDLQLEKQLSRAAEIAHQAYLTFREDTWDTPIVKIEDTEDALITYDGDQSLNKDFFVKFPHHLVKNERAKEAVLSMMMCNEPLAWTHDLLQGLFRGLRVHIDEIDVDLRCIPRKTIAVHPNGFRQANWPSYLHALLRFTSIKTKTQWVLDFGGGQYGIRQAFWRWPDYMKSFVNISTQLKVSPFGATKALLKVLGELDGNPYLTYGMMAEVAKVMDSATTTAANSGSFTISTMVSEVDGELFNEQKLTLLTALHEAVSDCVQKHPFKNKIHAAKAFEARFPGRSHDSCHKVTQEFILKYPAKMERPVDQIVVDGVKHIYF